MTSQSDRIDAEIDEILAVLEIESDMDADDTGRYWIRSKKEAHAKIKRLVLEERLAELLNIPFNDGRFSPEWIEEHWWKRIKNLKEEIEKNENP